MTRLKTILTTLAILTAGLAVLIAPGAGAATTDTPIGFGMEAGAINVQTQNGVAPDYGTFWIGPWTLNSGWGGPDNSLTTMKNAGVTPAIHFYYWGDDITPDCVENGCWSSLHNSHKNKAGWNTLADQLIQHLNAKMGGEEVVIFMESEFNKGGIQSYEPFDGYMADMADKIHEGYPNAKIVMSLGSWGKNYWGNFDRTAAASDYIGIQGMRGSTKDSSAHYDDLYETTLSNAQYLQSLFGKPIFIQDLALSSYPEPAYLSKQSNELQQFFDNLGELKSAGVMAIVYRSWNDSPNMNLANYYGEAERHWGLSWSGTSDLKAAGHVWVAGVKAERSNAAPTPAPAPAPEPKPAPAAFTASFSVPSNVNEWWVEVKVQGSEKITKVEASHNGGPMVTLPATSWGTHAKSFHATPGSMVFKATSSTGATVTSDSMSWLGGSAPAPQPAPQPAPKPSFTATFTPKAVGNQWWVETAVESSSKVSKVEVRVNDGAYTTLPATSWGTYAKSIPVPSGSTVTFRATDGSGQTVVSKTIAWGTAPAPAPSFTATFTPKAVGNAYWVETAVDSKSKIAKVEARVGSGSYTTLPATNWDTYAKSFYVAPGAMVTFRATDDAGQTVVSKAVAWK